MLSHHSMFTESSATQASMSPGALLDKLRSTIGLRKINELSQPHVLTITNSESRAQPFLVLAGLDDPDRQIWFAVKCEFGTEVKPISDEIFVIKELQDHRKDAESFDAQFNVEMLNKQSPSPNIYKPECYTSTVTFTNSTVTFEKQYIVYPYVIGTRLDDFCEQLRVSNDAFNGILKVILNMFETAAHIEQYNAQLPPGGLFGKQGELKNIWDINIGNMIVDKDELNVIYIDYTSMRLSPHQSFQSLIIECLQRCVGINSAYDTARQGTLKEKLDKIFSQPSSFKDVSLDDQVKLLKVLEALVQPKVPAVTFKEMTNLIAHSFSERLLEEASHSKRMTF